MDICVFCASARRLAKPYERAAEELGRAIGERGHGLVFGGYETGLMGTVARAAKAAGAHVVGVLPCKDGELPGRPAFACDELVEAQGLSDRKARMEDRADAFVALPGSYGTLDELYTVLSGQKLVGGSKPVALLDVAGFFAPLDELDRRMVRDGFMHAGMAGLRRTFDRVGELMEYLETHGRAGE